MGDLEDFLTLNMGKFDALYLTEIPKNSNQKLTRNLTINFPHSTSFIIVKTMTNSRVFCQQLSQQFSR
jgi:hypothetical protein